MAENIYNTQAADFEPAIRNQQTHSISRPSLSYWQDAWLRLKANNRAMISLYIVSALLFFTIAGPFIWTVDPAFQDLDQVSQPPNIDRKAILIEPYPSWDRSANALADEHTAPMYLAPQSQPIQRVSG